MDFHKSWTENVMVQWWYHDSATGGIRVRVQSKDYGEGLHHFKFQGSKTTMDVLDRCLRSFQTKQVVLGFWKCCYSLLVSPRNGKEGAVWSVSGVINVLGLSINDFRLDPNSKRFFFFGEANFKSAFGRLRSKTTDPRDSSFHPTSSER